MAGGKVSCDWLPAVLISDWCRDARTGRVTFLSVAWAHLGWHLGITRKGAAKRGRKTVFPGRQRAVQFLFREAVAPGEGEVEIQHLNNVDIHKVFRDEVDTLKYIDEE